MSTKTEAFLFDPIWFTCVQVYNIPHPLHQSRGYRLTLFLTYSMCNRHTPPSTHEWNTWLLEITLLFQDTGTPTREINRDASSQGTNYGSSGSHHTATNGPRHRAAERTVRADVEPPPPTDNPSSHGTSGSYHTAPSSSRRRPAHGVAVTLNERQPLLVDQHAL